MRHRNIETKIWDDSWFSDLDPIEKLLFIYLFTNNRATLCGIYELPIKIMSTETGIEKDMLIKIINRFEEKGKVIYYKGFMALKNSEKYQSKSPSIKIGIKNEKSLIPQDILKELDRVWGGCIQGVVAVAKSRVEESRVDTITTKVVEESSEEFNYGDYLNTMKEDSNKAIQLIRVFFMEKKLKFKTKKEVQFAITRNIKEANTLMKTFEIDDVIEAIEFVKDKYPDIWTLETLSKYLINHRITK